MKNVEYVVKPINWPQNHIERQLDLIFETTNRFMENPNYRTREALISLVTSYDLNQNSYVGVLRTTEYEVALINSLYIESAHMQCEALKVYLYELISIKTRMQKIASWSSFGGDLNIKEFDNLMPQLKLYYYTYQRYTVEKNKNYSEHLIDIVEELLEEIENDTIDNNEKNKSLSFVTHSYINLLQDIAFFRAAKRVRIWKFDKTEIHSLMKLTAKLIKKSGDSPTKRPLKGVLNIIISTYILKSRNGYNEDYIYKYVSETVADECMNNHQLWMSKIEFLNDDRELNVIPELFEDKKWKKYSWVSGVDFKPKRTYYVSSFSKSKNNEEMCRKYGSVIFGYKNDRIADLIAPIHKHPMSKNKIRPMLSQVLSFDVLYDKEEAKKELIELMDIINMFDISSDEKHMFFEEIMQYWILSVKDEKWSKECERRYVVFMYDNLEYIETDTTDRRYLKTKTSMFLFPDFVLGNNYIKDKVSPCIHEKTNSIATNDYLFCENCLNCDYDADKNIKICAVCNSDKVKHIYPI